MAEKSSIDKVLRDNRRFLAYVKINALLHDADKVTADFLEWSMRKNVKSLDPGVSKYSGCYTKHNEEDRSIILECLKDILPYQDAFNPVPLPCKKIVNSPYKKQPAIFRDAGQGTTIYDFFRHHHKLNLVLDAYLPSSLLLFSPGTAGIDGIDTGFETEAFRRPDLKEHHTPDLLDDEQAAIATPFGFERKVDWHEAGKNFLTLHDDLRLIHQILDDIGRGKEALSLVNSFMEKLSFSFGRSIIRTGRPVNDVTLADHSISVAALTTAQAVRMVMETEAMPKNSYYCMPIRRIGNSIPHWPQTGFAVFSCAVNAGSLDSMAVDLKDISAIRGEVKKYFDAFQTLFTETLPVGGTVYRDQHGIHLVVPVLGDPDYRWMKGSADNEWCSPDPAASGNDDFVNWLLDIGREKLLQLEDIHFGRELLTGLRVADIGQELNRLAEAIEWSRTFSTLHVKAEDATNGATRYFSRESSVSGKEKPGQLCKVCNLRVSTNMGKRGRQKCAICTERILSQPPLTGKETNDLKEMAGGSEDNRLALLTVSFNLYPWLSEQYNSGIFCFPKAKPGEPQDFAANRSPRLNSFGRFRRIWRTTEDFLTRQQEYIYRYCRPSDGDAASRMRTILLEPQDMQIILPAEKAGHVLDRLLENFELEFGRVAGRIPLHVSLLVFPFSTPIYLVLEGATRLRRANLKIIPEVAECCRRAGELRRIVRGRRKFEFKVPIKTEQKFQPKNAGMDDRDRFHANLEVVTDDGSQWCFAEEFEADEIKKVLMIPNMLSIAEIGGGFVLNELGQSAEDLSPTRCHSIPLEYWRQLKRLLRIEENISASQRRAMRGILAERERHWPEEIDSKTRQLAIEMLWRDPARIGSQRWKDPGTDQKLLCDCCLNGMIFLAGLVEKRLGKLS